MLSRQRQIRTQIQKLVDAGLFTIGFWLAHCLRAGWQFEFLWERPDIQPFEYYLWMVPIVFLMSPLVLRLQGFYDRPLVASRRRTAWQIFWACAWVTMILVIASFFVREQPARAVIILFGGISFWLVSMKEEVLRRTAESSVGRAQLQRRLMLVGTPQDTKPIRDKFGGADNQDIAIVTEVDLNDTPVQRLVELLHEHSANGVILSAKHTYFGQVEKVVQACELEGVEVWLLADFFRTEIFQTTLDEFQGRPMLVFRSTPEASWQGFAKNVVDAVGAVLLLLFFAIPMLVVTLLIKLSSPGPVLFRQKRAGLNGKPFTMLKFRSMGTDAEQRKHELALLNEMSGPVFKVSNDPRVTPVGRFIRKFSIDEFPQLFNVLRGEMSLVGPRPLPVDEVKRFDDLAHRRRLSVKPGLTCLWQVRGRNEVKDFRDWVRLDLEYIDNWSLWLDFKILFRTVPVVLLGTGAK